MTAITEAGIYPGADYRDLPPGLSYSGAKDVLRSPALYRWKRTQPRTPTEAMELGTVTHSLILETGRTWATIPGGTGVTKRREETRAANLIPVTLDQLAAAARMAAAVTTHDEAARWLSHCARREVTAVAQDPETGVWVRCIFDALHDGGRYGIDVKTGRDGTLTDFGRSAANLGYDLQDATYRAVMEWLGQPLDAFAFLVVESEPPHFVGVRELDEPFVERGRRLLRRALDTYAECAATDTWPAPPAYQTVSAPKWALYQEGITA